jgi:hypothetical protein
MFPPTHLNLSCNSVRHRTMTVSNFIAFVGQIILIQNRCTISAFELDYTPIWRTIWHLHSKHVLCKSTCLSARHREFDYFPSRVWILAGPVLLSSTTAWSHRAWVRECSSVYVIILFLSGLVSAWVEVKKTSDHKCTWIYRCGGRVQCTRNT